MVRPRIVPCKMPESTSGNDSSVASPTICSSALAGLSSLAIRYHSGALTAINPPYCMVWMIYISDFPATGSTTPAQRSGRLGKGVPLSGERPFSSIRCSEVKPAPAVPRIIDSRIVMPFGIGTTLVDDECSKSLHQWPLPISKRRCFDANLVEQKGVYFDLLPNFVQTP